MGNEHATPWLTIELTWQRLVAGVCVVLALGVLAYGFLIRPAVSTYVGRQIGQRLGDEVAEEIAQAVVTGALQAPITGGEQPAPPAGAAQVPVAGGAPGAAAQAPAAAQVAGAGPQAVRTPVPGQLPADTVAQAVVGQLQPTAQAAGGQAASAPPAADAAAQATPAPGLAAPTAAAGGAGAAAPAPLPTAVVATPIAAPQSERSVQEIVETLPPGEITVTEEKLNAKIAPRVARMAPIEGIQVRFVPGLVQVTLTVFGNQNLATAGLGISGNRVVVRDPQLDGPLGVLVSAADLVKPIEEELNDTLALAERQVRAVRIEQGQIVVTLN